MAFYEIEPFGPARGEVATAQLTALVANIAGKKSTTTQDWMPKYGKTQAQPDEMLSRVLMLNEALGGKNLMKKKPKLKVKGD